MFESIKLLKNASSEAEVKKYEQILDAELEYLKIYEEDEERERKYNDILSRR